MTDTTLTHLKSQEKKGFSFCELIGIAWDAITLNSYEPAVPTPEGQAKLEYLGCTDFSGWSAADFDENADLFMIDCVRRDK